MDPGSVGSAVRLNVAQCCRSLSSSADRKDVSDALKTLNSYLDDGAESSSTAAERDEFRRTHYSRTLRVLVGQLQAAWTLSLSSGLWEPLFLQGPPDQALLVLLEAVSQLRPSAALDRLVSVTERFLQGGRLADLLWSFCVRSVPSDSVQLRETLLARLAALPDLTANRLHPNTPQLFTPQRFYPLLASEMLVALERTCSALRDGVDCSLTFVAQTLGKVCLQGHSGPVLAVMAPRLAVCTRSDMVWQRVTQKLLQDVPERCMESVLTGLLQAADSPDAFSRIVGNLVLTNKKAQFVLTHKVLLLQYKYETAVLRTVLGYLGSDRDRRPLLLQVVRSVSQAWANASAVKHTPQEQQLYVSKALLLAAGLLTDAELQELRSDLLQCLLGGMQSHLDSSAVGIRTLGMAVGECLSARMDLSGAKLQFEYDKNEETLELLSLMTPSVCPDPDRDPNPDPDRDPNPDPDPQPADGSEATRESSRVKSASQRSKSDPESDLDSDDDLPPYDMSGDVEASRAAPPRYLRDCLEALISSDDSQRVELSLRAAESLVRRNFFAAKEISVQMTKVLLHMEDKFGVSDFLVLRQAAMVALTAVDSVPVTQYLTTEFYSLNYSLRQRLDILEVLALAAQELSKPAGDKTTAAASEPTPYQSNSAASWRQEVEKRIQNKTKRISKRCAQRGAGAAPNRYAPVAGYFFFPLLRNYDKPEVTFDLLGSDHLVLGRLIHTLGLFMHLAVNAPVAVQMGAALLDFVWAVRYHTDQTVRRGVLFAVCSVFLSMPSQALMTELSQQLLETRTWLADVAEADPDADCRSLAVQSLVLLDQNLKKQLQNPNGLSLES
ncbi:telomere length regulation protein TEL2 homolog [Poeciliopsis prolifica]|uniref:telomere length regulation protein TEL2 homolog n=1 Tax=Poeciliopsis prolifica TaxID=188132 RepID=UPI0024140FFC|nr:telomere length regulation protein TEL2 homolog [Poeciliopsis prolifica]XP_054914016.1 telomere length regulation protein TEL2 homolog [Poeciliopsis prolifica]